MVTDASQHRPRPSGLIVLTGFRATGKSVVGRQLANLLGYGFVDTDEEIVRRQGCSIADLVREQGWDRFRELEREMLIDSRALHHTVLATGGGAICHTPQWRELRNNSLVIWLRAEVTTIRQRLRGDTGTIGQRPALEGDSVQEEVQQVLAQREPLYRAGSDLVIETGGSSPGQLAELINEFIVGRAGESNQSQRPENILLQNRATG